MGEGRSPRIAGILLAAGGSARLGTPKQLLPFGGRPLIQHALDILLRSPVDDIIVVLGAHADEIAPLVKHPRARIVANAGWEQGQSASLRAALAALPPCDAAIFLPCDMPWVTPELIAELIRAWRDTGKPIVAAASGGRLGVPALFAHETFEELRAASGDIGGRDLLRHHPDRVAAVPVPAELLADIDTPEEYQRAVGTFAQETRTANNANRHE